MERWFVLQTRELEVLCSSWLGEIVRIRNLSTKVETKRFGFFVARPPLNAGASLEMD